jgi:diguanylate cyclase
LVLFSIMIAIVDTFVALNLGIRINRAKGTARYIWLLSGAVAMGLGIWSMHFIAMLAFHLSIPVTYNVAIVMISIIPAIVSSGIALYIVSGLSMRKVQVIFSALFMAIGIVCMHYIGMEAMEMGASIRYNPFLWALSFIIAFLASLVALHLLVFVSRNIDTSRIWWRKAGSALIMGIAISGMHYTGMSAASFRLHHHPSSLPGPTFDSTLLAYLIGIGMLILLGVVYIGTVIDKQFESKSIEFDRKFRSLIESATDSIIVANRQGDILLWNKGAQSIFGYEEKEVLGKNLHLIIPERFREAHHKGMQRYLSTGQPRVIGKTVELKGLRKDGDEFPIELSISTWQEQGNTYFSSIIRDITERKQAEEKINKMVYLDPLTGLPNRLLLNDRLSLSLDQANESKRNIGIMFIDLDRFKFINDTLGHAIGDQLLIEVAKRIQACVGKSDTVCRQGGDEFIVLLPNTSSDEVTKRAKSIVNLFSQSIVINEHEMFVTPSIGISLFPSDGRDKETLIKNADTAMYRVKEQGKNNFQFYTPEMNEIVLKKMQLEIGLRKAIERGEFTLHYQPQVDITSGRLIGVEALIRWQHPEMGNISPAEFISLAEETGLIIPIGEWVLFEACQQNKSWQLEGLPHLRMAVNISSRQFQHSNLIEVINNVLNETGLDPEYLELELTESSIQDSKHAITTMHKLKDMGIHLSIDDFGTGYSSLSYLKTFPINTLKIDQTFIKNIFTDSKDASLVETIINMAQNLDLKVIAEGVETKQQLQFLQQRHCNEAQGYYFSKPINAEEITNFMKKHQK